MKEKETIQPPKLRFVSRLPDLIRPEEYADSGHKKVRIQIQMTDEGIEILADSMYPFLIERLLAQAGAKEMDIVLCG